MIKLSRLTDYAVALLAQIAHEDKRLWAAPELAETTGLPQPTVSKVLKKLAKSGIVTACRGAAGGYRLAAAPGDVNVMTIVEAMDGPIAITDCAEGSDSSCTVKRMCPMQGHWNVVNRTIRAALQNITLADMMGTPSVPPEIITEPFEKRTVQSAPLR